MGILSSFSDLMISAIPVVITQADDGTGHWVDTETLGDAIKGIKYKSSYAERLFNTSWATDAVDVFITEDSTLTTDTKLRINSVDYACDFPEDVAEQGEVYVVGLRSIQ